MTKETLNEREFELINIIGADLGSNQRELSRIMDLSLGMTNMLIKRLISKGYIRINQLNKRKVQYFLTPKGFAEKMRKSVRYTLKTINSIGLIKNHLKTVITDLYQKGHRCFYIYSEKDLRFLIDRAFAEAGLKDVEVRELTELPQGPIDGVLLAGKERTNYQPQDGNVYVDLLKELAKKEALVEVGRNGHK